MSKVLIGMDKSKSFRVYLTITTEIVEEARKLHDLSPLACAGLGRVLTGAGLMSTMLKNESDRMTMIFRGDGPAKQILVCGNGKREIKGYIANPDVELPLTKEGKLDVGGSLGIGELTVIKDLGMKEPYTGTIALVTGEIADDLTAYFFISEQQNTSIALGVKVGRERTVLAAGGMFIQMLPGATEEAISALETMLGELSPLTTLIEETLLTSAGMTEIGLLENLCGRVFAGISEDYKPEVLGYDAVHLRCDCSKERMEQALISLGKKELKEIIQTDGRAELGCHFCGNKYEFTKAELEEMLLSI